MDVVMVCLTTITFLCLWLPNERVWQASYLLLLVIGLIAGSLTYLALIPAIFLIFSLKWYKHRKPYFVLVLFAILAVAIGLGLHVVPGFNNYQHLSGVSLSPTAADFDIWFNYDKSMFGLLAIGIVLRKDLIRSFSELKLAISAFLPLAIFGITLVYLLGIALGYSSFDWTPSLVFLPWALKNIVFTVLAEEMVFRGLIQRELSLRFNTNNIGAHLSVVVPGILFGVAHFGGGLYYVLLSSVAGILYGYTYKITGRIEAPIATHFLLNAGHFLFFSYPYSAV